MDLIGPDVQAFLTGSGGDAQGPRAGQRRWQPAKRQRPETACMRRTRQRPTATAAVHEVTALPSMKELCGAASGSYPLQELQVGLCGECRRRGRTLAVRLHACRYEDAVVPEEPDIVCVFHAGFAAEQPQEVEGGAHHRGQARDGAGSHHNRRGYTDRQAAAARITGAARKHSTSCMTAMRLLRLHA
jgi:hypothetical protein